MAQYSANPYTIEAYQIGTTAPSWILAAITEDKIIHALKGNVSTSIDLETPIGIRILHTGDYIIRATDGTFSGMAKAAFETAYLEDVAPLDSVLELTDETPTGDGLTIATPTLWSIDVANTVMTIRTADIKALDAGDYNLYSDAAFSVGVLGASTIALTAGAATVAYIKVTSVHGTLDRYYAVTINRAEA